MQDASKQIRNQAFLAAEYEDTVSMNFFEIMMSMWGSANGKNEYGCKAEAQGLSASLIRLQIPKEHAHVLGVSIPAK